MITPYKQTLSHSCLAACMLMLSETPFTENEEQNLTLRGSKRINQFYVAGIPLEFVKKYGCQLTIFVDNTYFANVLESIFLKETQIKIRQKKITTRLIKDLLVQGPLICHIDDHCLGDYSHASHFIILEHTTDTFISMIDPWTGKRRKLSTKKLEEGIIQLKSQIKMCPLLFSVTTNATNNNHLIVQPPSTTIVCPTIYSDSSDTRNTAA